MSIPSSCPRVQLAFAWKGPINTYPNSSSKIDKKISGLRLLLNGAQSQVSVHFPRILDSSSLVKISFTVKSDGKPQTTPDIIKLKLTHIEKLAIQAFIINPTTCKEINYGPQILVRLTPDIKCDQIYTLLVERLPEDKIEAQILEKNLFPHQTSDSHQFPDLFKTLKDFTKNTFNF